MHVPLTVLDFIERAELVYGGRVGVIDEPDQPAESLGDAHVERDRPPRSGASRGPRRPRCRAG